MIKVDTYGLTEQEQLDSMVRVIIAQSDAESDALAVICNAAALMDSFLGDINWVGFYLMRQGELVLGPFQGKPACSRIKVGEGVCGTCVQTDQTMIVADVNEFPGHIACDSASRSELVVPVRLDGKVIAVIDCDSPSLDRFTQAEARAFEAIADHLAPSVAAILR